MTSSRKIVAACLAGMGSLLSATVAFADGIGYSHYDNITSQPTNPTICVSAGAQEHVGGVSTGANVRVLWDGRTAGQVLGVPIPFLVPSIATGSGAPGTMCQ